MVIGEGTGKGIKGRAEVVGSTSPLTKGKKMKRELRMLRCVCRVRKLDRITNERIRRNTKVGEI